MKRIITTLLIISMILSVIPVATNAQAATYGKCGVNATWSFDKSSGTLTIDGFGEMKNYGFSDVIPWSIFNKSIVNVEISDGITSIGDRAFHRCSVLKNISIPSSVMIVGEYAFSSCIAIENIQLPDSIISISPHAFSYCYRLKSIVIPKGVTAIEFDLFSECSRLESVTIHDGVKTIDGDVFRKCISLKNIVIPDSVTDIGPATFAECISLESVKMSENIDTVYSFLFFGCKKLKTIVIPESVKIIEKHAFLDCTSLEQITIPDSVAYIEADAFENTGYYNNEHNWTDGVLYIGNCLIEAKTDIEGTYAIKEGTRLIANSAFPNCKNLMGVTIPDSVMFIGQFAFAGTGYYYNHSNWENGVLYIDDCLIEIKRSMTGKYEIRSGTRLIADYAFSSSSITDIVIPKSVVSIGWFVFFQSALERAVIPNNMTSTVFCMFADCKNLKEAIIPDNIEVIERSTFVGCENLKNVVIPNSVKEIRENAFTACKSLETITIPDSVKKIYGSAFSSCNKLKEIHIPDSVVYIGAGAFSGCLELRNVYISENIDCIEWGIFYGCVRLDNVLIPDGVRHIGKQAFYNCERLKTITLPDSVELINKSAFEKCPKLTNLYYNGTEEQFGKIKVSIYNECFKLADTYCRSVDENSEYYLIMKDADKMFVDVIDGKWYNEYIDYAVTYRLFKGTSSTEFEPNTALTRAMFVTVLARMSGAIIYNDVETKFKDVAKYKWYTGSIKWASNNKIVNGVGDSKFEPNTNITREQMCVMLTNYAKFKGITFKPVFANLTFADDSDISVWAKEAVYTCQIAGIINGKGDNKFEPKGTGTRAEAATVFSRFHKEYQP